MINEILKFKKKADLKIHNCNIASKQKPAPTLRNKRSVRNSSVAQIGNENGN